MGKYFEPRKQKLTKDQCVIMYHEGTKGLHNNAALRMYWNDMIDGLIKDGRVSANAGDWNSPAPQEG